MLHFIATPGHRYTFDGLLDTRLKDLIQVLDYEQLSGRIEIPPEHYFFTDIDRLTTRNLSDASQAYRKLKQAIPGIRLYNDPAIVKTRFSLIRALFVRGLASYNAYRLDEQIEPRRFPVFIRTESGHAEPLSDLLDNMEALQHAVREIVAGGIPERHLIVVEFSAEKLPEGVYRKMSAYRIGDQIIAAEAVHDTQWCVKLGKLGVATAAMYEEERQWIEDYPHTQTLMQCFRVANIDYGRIDFGIVDGKVEPYEINTNPNLKIPKPHASPVRQRSVELIWERLIEAFEALL